MPIIETLLVAAGNKNNLWSVIKLATLNKLAIKDYKHYNELMSHVCNLILNSAKIDDRVIYSVVHYLKHVHEFEHLKQICEMAIAQNVEPINNEFLLATICREGRYYSKTNRQYCWYKTRTRKIY